MDSSPIFSGFAEIAQPLTELTGKRVPNRVPWGEKENLAFEKLKEELCKATNQSMSIADFSKPYLIEVDSSANTVGAALLQSVEGQGNRPIAFASQKLTATQKAWSTIQKEAYAAIWALQKFRNWIFGQPTTVIYRVAQIKMSHWTNCNNAAPTVLSLLSTSIK